MSRRSTNVVMVERTHESGRSMEVSAREVVETGDQVARFSDFVIEQEGVRDSLARTRPMTGRARSCRSTARWTSRLNRAPGCASTA